jgi:phasin family protein
MFSNAEQYMNTGKSLLESQTTAFNAMANSALQGTEKLAALNLAALKASTQDIGNVLSQATSVRDPQAFFNTLASQWQPNAEKATSYARYVGEILTETQSAFSKAAETQIAEVSRVAAALVDQMAAAAPGGSSDAAAFLKSIMGTANAVYEQVNKVAKQAGEAMQTQAANLSSQYVQPVRAAQSVTTAVTAPVVNAATGANSANSATA